MSATCLLKHAIKNLRRSVPTWDHLDNVLKAGPLDGIFKKFYEILVAVQDASLKFPVSYTIKTSVGLMKRNLWVLFKIKKKTFLNNASLFFRPYTI